MLVIYLAITSFVFKDFLKINKQSNISIKKASVKFVLTKNWIIKVTIKNLLDKPMH